jgi:molybdopterin-guanine dinucleotide biosynthesis protein
MPDFLGLLLANPVLFVDAGTAMQAVFTEINAANETFTTATSGMPEWQGEARTAQDAKAKSTAATGTSVADALQQAGRALVSGGADLTEATTTLREQVDLILAEGYLVLASGLVIIGPAQEAEAAAATVGAEAVIAGYEAGAIAWTSDLDMIVAGATVVDEETAAQIQAAGELIGLPRPGPSPLRGGGTPATVQVWNEHGMPIAEYERKARALKDLSDRDLLYKASNPVARDPSVTNDYRGFTIGRIRRLYADNPSFRDSLIDNVTNDMSPDHVHELQLGGPDTRYNLRFLDRFTNERIGTRQIWPQIRNLPDGTPIVIEVLGP